MEICTRRKKASWDVLFGMLGYDLLLMWIGSVGEVALECKRKQIQEAKKRLLRQASEGGE